MGFPAVRRPPGLDLLFNSQPWPRAGLRPNGQRAGYGFRSSKASTRLGLVCYDLEHSRFLFLRGKWGHPAWHPDSRTVVEPGNIFIDSDHGTVRRIPGLPSFPGSHPSISPDGRLFVTDTLLEPFGGVKGEWGIVVGRIQGGDYVIVHRFDNSRGARSWRRSHPHRSFSPDGKRIYFNVSSTAWTRLTEPRCVLLHAVLWSGPGSLALSLSSQAKSSCT